MSSSSEPSIITLVKPIADCRQAGGFVVSVVLMHDDRNVRIHLGERLDHMTQHDIAGVGARAAARLQDHRGVAGLGRAQDGETLFHVLMLKAGNAVVVLGGVVQQLPKCDKRHFQVLPVGLGRVRPTAVISQPSRPRME